MIILIIKNRHHGLDKSATREKVIIKSSHKSKIDLAEIEKFWTWDFWKCVWAWLEIVADRKNEKWKVYENFV